MNKADRERLDRLSQMSCIACGRRPVEIHHIVDKGYRRLSGGHMATIPLDVWCHRGHPYPGVSLNTMTRVCGPSLARTKRQFIERYGTERSLLAKVDQLLSEPA